MSIYAYCRVSTKHQRITRQITNITELYPKAAIIREFYTGTTQSRPHWDKLIATIKKEDTIVFDSGALEVRRTRQPKREQRHKSTGLCGRLIGALRWLVNREILSTRKI